MRVNALNAAPTLIAWMALHPHPVPGVKPVIVHRDVKASNVLLDKEMRARVSDVGLAREMQHTVTQTRGMGTPGYVDPEYNATLQLTTGTHAHPMF